jgi:hypothetical protein
MKKNPRRVTRFGAIHIGRSSTKPFHYSWSQTVLGNGDKGASESYVMLENVARDEGLVDAGVLVRPEVL